MDPVLDNSNGGDILGTAAKLCTSMNQYNYISYHEIQANNTWGRYGVCSYNSYCTGGNDFTVGRAASLKVKEMEGQCDDNTDVGNWYSLTYGARCFESDEIGTNNCAWKELSHNTTITMDCLILQGFEEACNMYPDLPFINPSNVSTHNSLL